MAITGRHKRELPLIGQRCHGPKCKGKFRIGVEYDSKTGLQLCPNCRFPQKRNGHLAKPSNVRVFRQPEIPAEGRNE